MIEKDTLQQAKENDHQNIVMRLENFYVSFNNLYQQLQHTSYSILLSIVPLYLNINAGITVKLKNYINYTLANMDLSRKLRLDLNGILYI